MVNTTLERAEEKIEDQVVRYRELTEKRRVLRERIERAETEKRSVRDRVFQRVLGDYRRQLEETERDLGPVAAAVQEARAAIQGEIREIDIRTEEIQDRLDEIAFRHRVGEYDAAASNRLHAPLSDEYERLVHRRRVLSELLAHFDGHEETDAPEPGVRPAETGGTLAEKDDASPSSFASESETRPRGEIAPEAGEGSPAADAFVDPKDWVGEFVIPEPRAAGSAAHANAAAPAANDAADSLSDLADPSDDRTAPPAGSTSQPVERRIEPSDTLPILTVVSGPAAGKRVPLLPMTMTLGREVDNNIEIKDIDVARYHARISFEGGHYTIQDLEGSSGTFVDGQKVSKAILSPGSKIRVGNSELSLELA
ncbi:MAG: hypothetical protein H6Q78_1434 [Candidatus Krumholzibacteriota bacterium]|nr:hypothetical protein [Candidatus Krumholzibacteriota bacterium]